MLRSVLNRARNAPKLRYYSKNVPASKPESIPAEQKIPPPQIHRVTYEYPPPPNPKPQIPKESSAWRRHIPYVVGVGGLLWAGYAAWYFLGSDSGTEQNILTPDAFSTYRITCKQNVTDDLVILDISPKYAASHALLKSGATLWNAKKLWSIQIKHPMIQISRNYTPLPIYFMQSDRPNEPPLLRMMGTTADEGRMCLLVKKYSDGEMSRYLHSLPVGSDIEIRGPFIEHRFPYGPADSQSLRQPMLDVPTRMAAEPQLDPNSGIVKAPNVAMFTAGTGISTAFQMLLSPNNPPRGFTHVFHSARTIDDVPFQRFILFLESAGRAKFHVYIDDQSKFLTAADIPEPTPYSESNAVPKSQSQENEVKYPSVVQQFAYEGFKGYVNGLSQAVVCGPPGYISYVSGDPGYSGDQPIGGLLEEKGWKKNVKRMSDL